MSTKIGFIGAGNMGSAIIGGIIKKGLFKPDEILVYDKNESATAALNKDFNIKTGLKITDVTKSDILFLCVKPNVLYSVIDEIKDSVSNDTVIVSIAAGQTIEKIEKAFAKEILLVRVMPNTPALVAEGMSAIAPNKNMESNKNALSQIIDIFNAVGKAETVPERLIDAVTGISGSSPAYVFMFIEALADAGVKAGMSRSQAYTFCAQSVLGSAKMVLELEKHPAELKDMVCSPAGTTIEAVKVLEENGFRGAVMNAVDACVKKSQSM